MRSRLFVTIDAVHTRDGNRFRGILFIRAYDSLN
jgi:hypothetical protein